MTITTYNTAVIKEVINKNFTFADLSPRFKGVDSSTGNIFCPFHENHDTPAAKMYWDEDKGIWILHCFGECHRNFTAYDYVDRIFCRKYQKYSSPLQFLRVNMPENKLGAQLDFYQKSINNLFDIHENEKKIYIDNTYAETGNVTDFIEALYTA
jgi:hypothetical protein